MNDILLEAESLLCGYGKKTVIACDRFELRPGSMICLIGPNGSGKSTLLKTLSGYISPISGRVSVSGENAHLLTPARRARHIAAVPQEFPADVPFTVFDMVLMGRASHLGTRAAPSDVDYGAASGALSLLGLEVLAQNRFDRLSGGQKRLTVIARALAAESEIILLDEPDSGLDIANRLLLWKALRICRSSGRAVLLSTHNHDCVAELGAQALCVSEGKAVLTETLSAEILAALYGVPFYAIGGAGDGLTRFIPETEGMENELYL